jgi:raffinose/stachyose/melibiose transport system substrate-binding protein
MVRYTKRLGLIAALAALPLALTACSGSSTSETSSGAATSGATTLKLWHYEGADSAMGKAWNESIKVFETEHPGVKVEFEQKAFEQIQQTAGMVLSSDQGPDIMEYNKGNATAGLRVAGAPHRPDGRGQGARLGHQARPEPAGHGAL